MMVWVLLLFTLGAFGESGNVVSFPKQIKKCKTVLSKGLETSISKTRYTRRNVVVSMEGYKKLPTKRVSYTEFVEHSGGYLNDVYIFKPYSGMPTRPNFSIRENGVWVHIKSQGVSISRESFYLLSAHSAGPRELGYTEVSRLENRVFTEVRFSSELIAVKAILDAVNAMEERSSHVHLRPIDSTAILENKTDIEQIRVLVNSWDSRYPGQVAVSRVILESLQKTNFDFINLNMKAEFLEAVLKSVRENYQNTPEFENVLWSLMSYLERAW